MIYSKIFLGLALFATSLLAESLPDHDSAPQLAKRYGDRIVNEPVKPGDLCPTSKRSLGDLLRRQLAMPSVAACGSGSAFTNIYQDDIQSALDACYANEVYSVNNFPHEFHNYGNKLNLNGCKYPVYEFPIIAGGTYDVNSEAGADRVIMDQCGRFCAVITHRNMAPGQFQECNYHFT